MSSIRDKTFGESSPPLQSNVGRRALRMNCLRAGGTRSRRISAHASEALEIRNLSQGNRRNSQGRWRDLVIRIGIHWQEYSKVQGTALRVRSKTNWQRHYLMSLLRRYSMSLLRRYSMNLEKWFRVGGISRYLGRIQGP